jgi:hypothetical protein
MAPLFAKPATPAVQPTRDRRRIFPDLSARQISVIRELSASGNGHLVYDFLCADEDASDAVDDTGELNENYDADRAALCGFYREAIAWWQAYWTK